MLKVDMYVKVVLTVIAISLMVIAFRPMFTTPVEAGSQTVDVNIASIGGEAKGFRLVERGALPVAVLR